MPPAAQVGTAAATWAAPSHWQHIDFVSDLHLCADLPRTTAAFLQHLQLTTADAVVVLGDLFELWVGDDMRTRPFENALLVQLATVSRQRPLFFMVGNRDFLAGPALLGDSGMTSLDDPTLLLAFGQRVLLSHGDALCLSDTGYQAFRREVRSPEWQQNFLAKPLQQRLDIAAAIRRASRDQQRFDTQADIDLDDNSVLQWLRQAQASTLVHGHTHRPGQHTLPDHLQRLVLTDWDLDSGHRAEVLRLSASGFQRRPPDQA